MRSFDIIENNVKGKINFCYPNNPVFSSYPDTTQVLFSVWRIPDLFPI